MVQQTLASRVDTLEQKMGRLEDLPDRMVALESQIVQFRAEVHVEFSAVREELRGEIRAMGEGLRGEMRTMQEGLRREMVTLNGETLTQMRILHEDVISHFALLDDHMNGRKGSRREPAGGRRRKKD